MITLPLSEAKSKLSGLIDLVGSSDQEVMITRNGKPAAILISPGELESLKETITVRSDAALMTEIKKGVSALRKKNAKLYTLDDLFG